MTFIFHFSFLTHFRSIPTSHPSQLCVIYVFIYFNYLPSPTCASDIYQAWGHLVENSHPAESHTLKETSLLPDAFNTQ